MIQSELIRDNKRPSFVLERAKYSKSCTRDDESNREDDRYHEIDAPSISEKTFYE